MKNMSEKTWSKKRKLKERKMRQVLKWATEYQSFTKRDLLAGPWKGLTAGTAVRFLKEMRDRGTIVMHGSTRKAYYSLAGSTLVEHIDEAVSEMGAAVEEAPVETEEPVNAWIAARSQTGQKAVNIVSLVDALLAGEAGLNALGEIRNQAVLILGDLELLEPAEE